jgi:hypothetical protein
MVAMVFDPEGRPEGRMMQVSLKEAESSIWARKDGRLSFVRLRWLRCRGL